MKKIFLLVLILSLGLIGKAQWPIIQNLASDSTLISVGRNFGGGIKGNLINTSYSDTTAANLQRIRQYAGGQIFTTGDTSIWLRSIGANKWVKLAGSAGATNIYNTSSTLTGNRTVSGNNLYNIAFDAVTTFRAEANAGTGKISSALVSTDSIFFQPNEGVFIIDSLASGASTDSVLVWTQATGRVKKRNASAFTTTSLPISSLTAATGTNDINNLGYAQTWRWNSKNTYGLQIMSTTTSDASSQALLHVELDGANASPNITSFGFNSSIGHTGTNSTNIAGRFQATGGTNNYAIIVPASSGSVGIGTSTPTSLLHVVPVHTTGIGAEFISSTTTSGSIVDITGTSTDVNNGYGLSVNISGTNANSGGTSNGIISQVSNTGISSTNVAAEFVASGATNNYAIIVGAGSGSVGIGTASPNSMLDILPTQTTGVGVNITSSSTTAGSIMNISGTSTALAAGNEGLNIGISGANGTNGITATGARISVTNTNATSGTNVGLDLTASGATTQNTALNVAAGDVLIAGMGNFADTTNFKPVVINTTGTAGTSNKLYKATYWPGGGGGGGWGTTGTVATLTGASTLAMATNTFDFSNGRTIFSTSGGASTPAISMTGNPYTAGTATTNHPLHYINGGTAPSTWSTAGTYTGINAVSGFTGNFLDYHVNGGASVAKIDYQGTGTFYSTTIGKYGGAYGITAPGDFYVAATGGSLISFLQGSQGFTMTTNAGITTGMNVIYGGNTGYVKMGSNLSIYGSAGETRIGAAGTENYLTINTSGYTVVNKRLLQTQGADVASVAGAISLGADGNTFEITGTNSITLISNVGWINGSEVTLMFTSTATLVNGTATSGTDVTILLAGAANFTASANDVITLVYGEIGGTVAWREKSRSVN